MLWKEICTVLLVWQYAANLPHAVGGSFNSRALNGTAGYCNEKQHTTVYKNITKTREVIRKTGRWIFKKTIKEVEYYTETEPHLISRIVLRCCEGYLMNEQQHCVPQCITACPLHADCVSPNICKCHHGYKEIREQTDLQETATPLQCLPPSNNVDTEIVETTTESTMDYDTYIWESSTDNSLEPTDDCRISDCPEYAKCLENGTCVCLKGYVWHEQRSQIPNELGMQLDMFCLLENYDTEARDISSESFSGFLFKVLVILTGVALAVGLATILIWRYKQNHSDQINVEAGNRTDKNMLCKYVSDKEEAADCVVY